MQWSQLRTRNPNTHPAERSEKVHPHSLSYGPRWAESPAAHPPWTCIAVPGWYLQWEQQDEVPDSSAINRENISKGKRNREGNKDRKEEKGSCTVSSWSPKCNLARQLSIQTWAGTSQESSLFLRELALLLSTHFPSVLWLYTPHQPTSAGMKSQAEFKCLYK